MKPLLSFTFSPTIAATSVTALWTVVSLLSIGWSRLIDMFCKVGEMYGFLEMTEKRDNIWYKAALYLCIKSWIMNHESGNMPHRDNGIPLKVQDQKAWTIHRDPEQIKPSLPMMKPAWWQNRKIIKIKPQICINNSKHAIATELKLIYLQLDQQMSGKYPLHAWLTLFTWYAYTCKYAYSSWHVNVPATFVFHNH